VQSRTAKAACYRASGDNVTFDIIANRGKESAENLKVN
jgi:cold shock CspA family protein